MVRRALREVSNGDPIRAARSGGVVFRADSGGGCGGVQTAFYGRVFNASGVRVDAPSARMPRVFGIRRRRGRSGVGVGGGVARDARARLLRVCGGFRVLRAALHFPAPAFEGKIRRAFRSPLPSARNARTARGDVRRRIRFRHAALGRTRLLRGLNHSAGNGFEHCRAREIRGGGGSLLRPVRAVCDVRARAGEGRQACAARNSARLLALAAIAPVEIFNLSR